MKPSNFKALATGLLAAYSLCAGLMAAQAQTNRGEPPTEPPTDPAAAPQAAAASAAAAIPMADGEVRKVDLLQGKITLKHGFIENLGMPGMTMVFKVADAKLLDGIKPGDKVRFVAEIRQGALLITALEAGR